MKLHVAAKTDVGLVRPQNEDNYLEALPLLAVADGMGGHNAGEVAAQLALDVLTAWRERGDAPDPGHRLREAVLEANRTILSRGQAETGLQGMGTTLTAAWVDGSTVTLAHVGDSRAYLLRGGTLSQLTEDQTLVRQWVDEGKIEAAEAPRHPYRSVLLQALGVDPDVDVEILSVDLQPGDRLLLATDGLHGMISDERIRDVLLGNRDPDAACRRLVEEANAAGGDDNITVLLLDAAAEEGDPADEAPAPVVVSKPASAPGRGTRRRRRRMRAGAALVLLALAGAVAGFLLARTAGPQYVVASRQDHVLILKGAPGQASAPARGRVVRQTGVVLSDISEPYRRKLRAGILVASLAEANRVVQQLPRVLGPGQTASPSPVPAPAQPQPVP